MNDQPWTKRHLYVIKKRLRDLPRNDGAGLTALGTQQFLRLRRARAYLVQRSERRPR